MSADAASPPASAGPPALPPTVELLPAPAIDGPVVELSLGKLATSLTWLFDSVDKLSKGMAQINAHLESNAELWNRIKSLEDKPPPEPVTIVQERARTPPPPPPPPPKIEIPYVPSEEERAEEARRAVRAMLDAEVAKLLEKINANSGRIGTLEDIEAKRKDPWARMQTYMQEIGFLKYGDNPESDPLVLLGQVLVLLRQDIAMCPKIKDLEDAETALKARINEVESFAASDREARSQAAAAESAKIREDLARVDDIVQGLVQKNIDDGDVAGGLRDLGIRVDSMEERRFPKLENRVRLLEEAEPVVQKEAADPRKKGFLESLAEVDLGEEVRRLRSSVECMEAAMPYETRQTLQFMREGGKASDNTQSSQAGNQRPAFASSPDTTMAPGKAGDDNSINLVNFREETDQQLERYQQKINRDFQALTKNLKNNETKVDGVESKILDLWKRLPKVLAVLEPLQAQLEMHMNPPPFDSIIDSTGGLGKPALPFMQGPGAQILNTTTPPPAAPTAPAFMTAGYMESPTAPATQAATPFLVQTAPVTAAPAPAAAAAPAAALAPAAVAAPAAYPAAQLAPAADTGAAPAVAAAAQAATQFVVQTAPVTAAPAAPKVSETAASPSAPVAGVTPMAPAPAVQRPSAPAAGGSIPPAAAVIPAGAPTPTAQKTPVPLVVGMPGGGLNHSKMLMGGFAPLPEGAAGTGEAGLAPSKEKEFSPVAQMGSLTGLIKIALQNTTNDIQNNLRRELYQCRTELLGGLDAKANKSELQALSKRIDAWAQKRQTRDRFSEPMPKHQERSLSPTFEQESSPMNLQQRGLIRTPSRPDVDTKSRELILGEPAKQSPTPAGKAATGAASPTLSEKKKTCHDRCKEPTCPRQLEMSRSLSRLPALKTAQ